MASVTQLCSLPYTSVLNGGPNYLCLISEASQGKAAIQLWRQSQLIAQTEDFTGRRQMIKLTNETNNQIKNIAKPRRTVLVNLNQTSLGRSSHEHRTQSVHSEFWSVEYSVWDVEYSVLGVEFSVWSMKYSMWSAGVQFSGHKTCQLTPYLEVPTMVSNPGKMLLIWGYCP